jgi:hypothetical protein
MLDVEIPPAHLFGHVLRIDRVTERLEIAAPDAGGWLHKEVKLRPQRLEKMHVADLAIGINESTMKLRANPDGTGGGFDIIIRAEAPRVKATRIGDSQEVAGPPFDLNNGDAGKVVALYDKLERAAVELTKSRKALAQVSLDNHALRDHENPAILVERLVTAMAPVVQEVAWRSRSATELVLKRLLADDRREEIFVAKAELTKKFDSLPANLRKVFDPLGLSEERVSAPSAPPAKPITRPTRPTPAEIPRKPATLPPKVEPKPAEPVSSDKVAAAGGEISIEPVEVSSSDIIKAPEEPNARRD